MSQSFQRLVETIEKTPYGVKQHVGVTLGLSASFSTDRWLTLLGEKNKWNVDTVTYVRDALEDYMTRFGSYSSPAICDAVHRSIDAIDTYTTTCSLSRPSPPSIQNDDRTCRICFSANRNVLMLPCKHLCCCAACALQLVNSTKKCPMCRATIESTLHVFDG